MKDLGEALAFAIYIAVVCGVFFVFTGSPDLWDVWRQAAMSAAECGK